MNLKNIAIGIGALFIAVLLWAMFIYSPKDFTYVGISDFSNHVENRSSISYADTVAHVALQVMGIEYIVVSIYDVPDHMTRFFSRNGKDLHGFVLQDSENVYRIFMSTTLSRNKYLLYMAHEVIHIAQIHEGRMDVSRAPFVRYEGIIYSTNHVEYEDRPWEIEAFDRQQEIKHLMGGILF